ncbi:hypothetical protein CSC17_1223 [Klebsiella oxytoca]|nr:hypothetical protein CSC17_1223 [Klebsiella oxytoca]
MRSIASGEFNDSALYWGGGCAMLPGAALNAPCPGYGFIAVCSAVARTDAQHHLREIQPLCSL